MSLTANHFELFSLPISFILDTDVLAQRYRELQRSVHPDNYAHAPEREQRLALQAAAQINEAFQTLKNPLLRARYLLILQGIHLEDAQHTLKDTLFLMEQMELRETLADIRHQAHALSHLERFLFQLDQRYAELLQTLANACQQCQWDSVVQIVQKLQFFKRLQEEALDLEETLNS
jgi:molecular chaperone HscB